MKLADITAAAVAKSPHLEVEVPLDNGDTVNIVFRNIVMVPEEDRQKLMASAAKALDAKGKTTNFRKVAEGSKATLAGVVENGDHIDLLEDIFSADPETRDLNWIALAEEYAKETQLGEVNSSQTP